MIETGTILTWMGTLIGGMVAGIIGAKKMPLRRNGNSTSKNGKCPLEISEKTGGARRISEEGLSKFNCIKKLVDEKYLTIDKHTDMCALQQAGIKLYISEELKLHTQEIINAIKINGTKNNER